ncbi:MAG: hypothetical protein GY811_25125 [Myxococcales bacterium]|nr:hypothetical protein [Myxococcales bacterium]
MVGESVAAESQERPGLGTRFGERRSSDVVQRRFERAAARPFAQVAVHYNNLAGIQQQSAYRGTRLQELRARTRVCTCNNRHSVREETCSKDVW